MSAALVAQSAFGFFALHALAWAVSFAVYQGGRFLGFG